MKVYAGLMPDLRAVPASIRRLEDLGYDVVMTTEIAPRSLLSTAAGGGAQPADRVGITEDAPDVEARLSFPLCLPYRIPFPD